MARVLQENAVFMAPAAARLPLVLGLAALGLAYALTLAWPARYAASASVLLPMGNGQDSRILRIEHRAPDPGAALRRVKEELRGLLAGRARLLDDAVVRVQRPNLALNLACGGFAGLGVGAGWMLARRRRPVRVSPHSTVKLCEQLLEQWFTPQRQLLPLVSALPGAGRSRLAAKLARAFAELGRRTLLIDGDLRAPSLHRDFGLPNRAGLADFLHQGRVSLVCAGENLSLLVAGNAPADPLELLSSPRLPGLLAEARRHFHVVLIDTPAAARGPDFEIFAAFAGGALLLGGDQVRPALERCAAKVVAVVLNHD
jgi:Mrp family chromosome partitioning ATPase